MGSAKGEVFSAALSVVDWGKVLRGHGYIVRFCKYVPSVFTVQVMAWAVAQFRPEI